MFILFLILGLPSGLLVGVLLVHRWKIRLLYAMMVMALALVLIGALPVDLSARIAFIAAALMGFLIALSSMPLGLEARDEDRTHA